MICSGGFFLLNVNRHTGGLENIFSTDDGRGVVNRHTGGLEIVRIANGTLKAVNRHTGGLEIDSG